MPLQVQSETPASICDLRGEALPKQQFLRGEEPNDRNVPAKGLLPQSQILLSGVILKPANVGRP